jgi:hypothetical protein
MSYTEAQDRIRLLEKEYCELMKRSFDMAAKDRPSADALNEKALGIKKELDALKAEHNQF